MPKNRLFLVFGFLCTFALLVLYVLPKTHRTDPILYPKLVNACPGAADLDCLQKLITNTINKDGLADGFKLLRAAYIAEPELRPSCHFLALTVGTSLGSTTTKYTKFSYTPESVWCNYGFYQGYSASLLIATGDIGTARSFCEYVGIELGSSVPDVEAECFRGIGRGLPFLKKEYWGDPRRMAAFATKTCVTISPRTAERAYCLSGVFNNLGREMAKGNYGLSVRTKDPLWLCREQDPDITSQCYGNLKNASLDLVENETSSVLFQRVADTYDASLASMKVLLWSAGYEAARKSTASSGEAREQSYRFCADIPEPYDKDCVRGFGVGLAKHGVPDEQHLEVINFCNAITPLIRDTTAAECSEQAILYLGGFYSPSRFRNACRDFDRELGISCE